MHVRCGAPVKAREEVAAGFAKNEKTNLTPQSRRARQRMSLAAKPEARASGEPDCERERRRT